MKKSDIDGVGCVGMIVVLGVLFVFVRVVVMGQDVREVLDFASTPYPTAVSGAEQNNSTTNNNHSNTSVIVQVATSAPPTLFVPTAQPTATPAPTATPQPTATQQATITAVWGYVVGTSEALQRRIEALEKRPTPQVERVGFVHYGTLGAALFIGVTAWLISFMAGREKFGFSTLPRNAQERVVLPNNVTVTQHNVPVTTDNIPVTGDKYAKTRKEAREKIIKGYDRGGLIMAFDNPAPYEFTALQKRKLQELHNAGVSKRSLMDALWGRAGSVSLPALNKALED